MKRLAFRDLIHTMTIEEKISLTSGKDFWNSQDIERLGLPSILFSGGTSGIIKPKSKGNFLKTENTIKSTCYPSPSAVASSWDINLLHEMGEYLGKEAISNNISVLLGPSLNIKRNPLCGRNFDYYSEDPYLTGKLGANIIKGIQSQGISACPKHFAVNSQEKYKMVIDEQVDLRALHEIYLEGFRYAIEEGEAKAIMTSHNKINGVYANEHKYLLKNVLREQWHFDGLVVSDWGGTNSQLEALRYGCGLVMPSSNNSYDSTVMDSIKRKEMSEHTINKRNDELLRLISHTEPHLLNKKTYDIDTHHKKAIEIAEKSIVLLKNEKNILPLKDKNTKISIIGDFAKHPRYQGSGSSLVNPTKLENFVEVFEQSDYNFIGYEQGFKRFGGNNDNLTSLARTLATSSDIVLLFLGLDETCGNEGIDRTYMGLNANQLELFDELYKYNQNIIVVLSGGSVIEMPFASKASAILQTYLSGQGGASAIYNILSGKTNPSGKLAETYPIKYKDIPSSKWFGNNKPISEHRESLFVGYRYFDLFKNKVLFPFGFGLSYTTFEYSNLIVDGDIVKVSVTNTGEYDGEEVVQLYVGTKNSSILRVKKELKAFTKTFIKKGETKEVTLTLDKSAFRYFNIENLDFEAEDCDYELFIGSSSQDIRLSTPIEKPLSTHPATSPFYNEVLKSYFLGDIFNITQEEFHLLLGTVSTREYWTIGPLSYNDMILHCKNRSKFGKFLFGILDFGYNINIKRGKFVKAYKYKTILQLPFRSLVPFTMGKFNLGMVDGLLLMVNGHFTKGLYDLIKSAIIR